MAIRRKLKLICFFFVLGITPLVRAEDPPTGADILIRLADGNRRFAAANEITVNTQAARQRALSQRKKPIATVLCCSDSPVPPEIIFDQPLGDLFVVRLAGNVVDDLALASLEYAVADLETPLLLILGHRYCGAVNAAIKASDQKDDRMLPPLLAEIRPAVLAARVRERQEEGASLLDLAVQANLNLTMQKILDKSPLITDRLIKGKLKVASGLYQMEDGEVKWLGVKGI